MDIGPWMLKSAREVLDGTSAYVWSVTCVFLPDVSDPLKTRVQIRARVVTGPAAGEEIEVVASHAETVATAWESFLCQLRAKVPEIQKEV